MIIHKYPSNHNSFLFSNTPVQFPEYPLQFPIRSWPKDDDPSFIGACHDDDNDRNDDVDNDDDELVQ